MRKTVLALTIVSGSLVGLSGAVFAQTAAAPQTLEPWDSATQGRVWDYYGQPDQPRLYNDVPQYRTHANRHYYNNDR